MKRLVMVLALIALAYPASAIDSGPGGTLYWDARSPNNTETGNILLFRVDLSTTWSPGTISQFDCVPWKGNSTDLSYYPPSTTSDQQVIKGMIEVYSPRTDNIGTGTLLLEPTIPSSAPIGPYGESAWVVDTVNPAVVGSAAAISAPNVDSVGVPQYLRVVRAPENWQPGTLSHGLSIVTFNRYDGVGWYLHDQDGNGTIAATSAEMTKFTLKASDYVEDTEMGPDRALYYTTKSGTVQRVYWHNSSTAVTQSFFTIGGAGNPAASAESFSSDGLAVGPVGSSPIVYTYAKDAGGLGAIFALKDGDGDNVVSPTNALDSVVEVWKNGDFGITVTNNNYLQDLELYVNPGTGKKWLFGNDYYGLFFTVQLSDNGLLGVAGKVILASGSAGPKMAFSGFELDMNPVPGAVVPEPGTLLLIGSGLMGGIGCLRRRRMN